MPPLHTKLNSKHEERLTPKAISAASGATGIHPSFVAAPVFASILPVPVTNSLARGVLLENPTNLWFCNPKLRWVAFTTWTGTAGEQASDTLGQEHEVLESEGGDVSWLDRSLVEFRPGTTTCEKSIRDRDARHERSGSVLWI